VFFGLLGKGIASAAHSFAKFFALLGRHIVPALSHAVLHAAVPMVAMAGVAMEAAEENPAENDKADPLPEGDTVQAQDLRQESVPQLHRGEAEDSACDQDEEDDFDSFEDWVVTH